MPAIKEDFRKLAAALAQACREQRLKAVLFTSATRGEGTTTVVLHAARNLREVYGLRPLVVEMNFRRPQMCNLLGLDATHGLAAALPGDDLQKLIQTDYSGVAILHAGCEEISLNPERIRDLPDTLSRLLRSVEGRFDLVMVDTPPVLEEPDTLSAAAVVPQVILVVRAGNTPREVIVRAKKEIAAANAMLVGAVLNRHKRYIPEFIYQWVAR